MGDKKNRILRGWVNIPPQSLVNYISQGDVTLTELIEVGLTGDKLTTVQNLLSTREDQEWNRALNNNDAESYYHYLQMFPQGRYTDKAQAALSSLEESLWQTIQANVSRELIEKYLSCYPNGKYVDQCEDLLVDLPWLKTKQDNTIQAYEDYMNNNPGKHVSEAKDAINTLNDEKDWNNACITNTSDAYRNYLNSHSQGKHVNDAKSKIQANAGRDQFLEELKNDPNSHSAKEIQNKVNNHVATWEDIEMVFGSEKCEAIKEFSSPTDLPLSTPPSKLTEGSTEVYFWGTPSSGKTCALGSILSSANNQGILEKENCAGYDYMTRLSSIFDGNGFCTFPSSTSIETIYEMILKISDKKKQHQVTLIDLAGELFNSVYAKLNDLFLDSEHEKTLKTAMNYLKDDKNKKIHFFVVEYGAHDKEWEEGVKMRDLLDSMSLYLKNEKVFRKSTVGVYVLVTKCDMIDCERADRPEEANIYVKKHLPSFYNNLQRACDNSGIKDLKTLSFSVGDVFAKNLCVFDDTDTKKVIAKLLAKTPAIGGRWDWLRQ